jgi:uncharacterized protein YjiS (DUF1127 family)
MGARKLQAKGNIMLYQAENPTNKSGILPRLQPLATLFAFVQEMVRRRNIRRNYRRMDEEELRDIGLTSAIVEHALSLPLARNAGDFLAEAVHGKPSW